MNEAAGVKLLLSYEVLPQMSQEYYQFVMSQYLPTMQAMGLQLSEAWHTAYGDAPNRLIGFVAADLETVQSLLRNEQWRVLNEQLEQYVTDFHYKVIPYRGGFQI
ncbi:MAG: hypothetical protein D6706_12485 [Chloroflexi bacterium]|nr:MAG: hypothetical protein D6706_12485 [Chloroflexota bacterium]